MEALDNAWCGSWKPLNNLAPTFQVCHLWTFNMADIFFRGHPYVWHTTICHDIVQSYTGKKISLVCCRWHRYSCCEKQSGEQNCWVLCTQPSHLASSGFGCTLSVGAFHLEDRLCASKKGRIRGGGRACSKHAMYMAAALTGCRTALVSTGWTISTLLAQVGHSSPLLGALFRDL